MAKVKQAFVSSRMWASINVNSYLAVTSHYKNDQLKMAAVLSTV